MIKYDEGQDGDREANLLFDQALIFAIQAHSGAVRKCTNVPYIVHPMEAAAIVSSMTEDKEVIAAAALHDVVEDTDYTIDDIRARFGERVANLVASETEDRHPCEPKENTWKIRKTETLERLKPASRETKIITLGDKLANLRAIHRDYARLGDQLWERFHQKDKREQAWYYSSFVGLLSDLQEFPAWQEYRELVGKVFEEDISPIVLKY